MSNKGLMALLLLVVSASAQATFDGRSMEGPYFFPDLGSEISRDSWTVGPGVEISGFPSADDRTDLDVSSNNINFQYTSTSSWTGGSYNGPVLLLCTPGPVIDTVSINGATNMVGLDLSRVSWDETSISINWNGLDFNNSTVVSLDVTFSNSTWPGSSCLSEPPEPSLPVPVMNPITLLLMAGMLGLLGLVRLRRSKV